MTKFYTIIIPVFNEEAKIKELLFNLKRYFDQGHEILVVDDGSTDKSNNILSQSNWINLVTLNENKGKGFALKKALELSKNEKIVIFDGDLELHPDQIVKLMQLNENGNPNYILGSRMFNKNYSAIIWTLGNTLLTKLFNIKHNSALEDALCCAKSFHKTDIKWKSLKSERFDIDVELTKMLCQSELEPRIIHLYYNRRYSKDGKKLKLWDSLSIIKRILIN